MSRSNTVKRSSRRSRQSAQRVEMIAVNKLTPHPRNPRIHSKGQIAAIAKNIAALGCNAPILVDTENRIIAGHARLEALKLLGLRKAPTICLEHLSEKQATAYMLADNQLASRSTWDDEKLGGVLKELNEIAIDFDMEVTGFEPPEIDFRIQSLAPPETVDSDEVEVVEGPPVSRIGDLWVLGSHRLFCGDARDPNAYGQLMANEKAAAAFADSPYNVKMSGHATGKGRKKHREFPMASGEMKPDEFGRFLTESIGLISSNSGENATFFACMDWRHCTSIIAAIESVKCELLNICVWVKAAAGMGALYRSQHEFIFVFGRKRAKRINNVQLGRFGRNRSNVWHYAGMNSFTRRGRTRGLDLHPTVKPLAMVEDAILDVTQRGDIVLDPFGGSGTTILAAERTGRRAYTIELDPRYVDTAIARWEKITGQAATHVSGKSFHEIQLERFSHIEEG